MGMQGKSYEVDDGVACCLTAFDGKDWQNVITIKSPRTGDVIQVSMNGKWKLLPEDLQRSITMKINHLHRNFKWSRVPEVPIEWDLRELKAMYQLYRGDR